MKLLSILMFLIVSIAISQTAENDSIGGNSGLVYGKDHAFWLTAPKGWVLDNSSGVSQGLHAVFYPMGGSWNNSPTVMYCNTSNKSVKGNETLQELLDYDISQFKINAPNIKITDFPILYTKDKKKVVLKKFIYSNYEYVAYIDEPKIIAMLVMTSRNEKELDNSLSAFKELINSYKFMTEDVKYDK